MAESKYKLTYFNTKGLSEYIRFALAHVKVNFEDNRIKREDWPALKETQEFGKLPVLEVDGKTINQSVAILRFLGKRFGLVANDPFTDALLEALVDNIRDANIKLIDAFHKKTPESLAEAMKIKSSLYDKLNLLISDGYFYGSKLTWVDIYFAGLANTLEERVPGFLKDYPKLMSHVEKVISSEGIQEYIKNKPVDDILKH